MQIKTCGNLREFLGSVLSDAGRGLISHRDAQSMAAVAGQITKNMHAELRAQELYYRFGGNPDRAVAFGELPLGGETSWLFIGGGDAWSAERISRAWNALARLELKVRDVVLNRQWLYDKGVEKDGRWEV